MRNQKSKGYRSGREKKKKKRKKGEMKKKKGKGTRAGGRGPFPGISREVDRGRRRGMGGFGEGWRRKV